MRTILLFLWVTQCFYAQKNYPKDYFISPLEIPLHLSGNFGELRNNHFHSGLDFKNSTKKKGLKSFCFGGWICFQNQSFCLGLRKSSVYYSP